MAGHCIRHPKLLASDLVLWEPMHGRAQQGRPRQSHLSMLLKEVVTNSKEELRTLMRDRNIWMGLSGASPSSCLNLIAGYVADQEPIIVGERLRFELSRY